jgi:hypothetical protein
MPEMFERFCSCRSGVSQEKQMPIRGSRFPEQ